MLGEVNAALTLWDRLKKLWDSKKNPPQESVATRFVRLFESHGVHRNQIPRFIGHGLTVKDMRDDEALLGKLDEALLEAVCSKFAVRREWLDGAESQVHPFHDFYKSPEDFAVFIDQLHAANPKGQLSGMLLIPEKIEGEAWVLIVLEEVIGEVGEKQIYRYHLLNNWLFTYWKSRAYLTACVAIAWKRRIYIRGRKIPHTEIERLSNGETLLGWHGNALWFVKYAMWYPEDMALEPAAYLAEVNPERNKFGITSGLKLWLDLDRRGLMDSGLGLEPSRPKFQQELAKYLKDVEVRKNFSL